MLRRNFALLLTRASSVCLQGWGSTGGGGWGGAGDSASAGGGWGSAGGSASAGGGWGAASDSASAGGGWGGASDSASAGGGWGSTSGTEAHSQWGSDGGRGGRSSGGRGRGSRGRGGWDAKGSTEGWGNGGGFGEGWGGGSNSADGWGGGRGGGQSGWGGDGGWRDAPTGGRQRGMRGGFRRGRGGSRGGGSGGGVWGQPVAADEEAWNAAPPSFQPPVRRVDPLTLTAVEVEVDGVKKLVGQRVQVSGLSDETTWHTLKDHLRQAGDITFCRLFSGGRGMVEFSVPEDAARCITELQGSELEGATLYLREDREDTVLINTRRKIRDARDAQLRARKEEAERMRREKAIAQGDVSSDSAVAQ